MQGISEWWKNLTPDKKKAASAGGLLMGLLVILYLFIAAGPDGDRSRLPAVSATDKNLLTGSDPKSLGLDALGNDLRANEEMTETLRSQLEAERKQREQDGQIFQRELERLKNQFNLAREEMNSQLGGFSRSQQDALENLRKEVRTLEDGTVVEVDAPKSGTISAESVANQGLFETPEIIPAVNTPGAPGQAAALLKVRVFGEEEISDAGGFESPHTVYLVSGSILSGVLINGLDAPTGNRARKDPMPALVRLKHDAILPNRYRSDVKECFIIVGATGDLSTERAFMRGEKLSCVRNDGRLIEITVDAYAVGEDGKVGMRGRLVSRNGALVAKGALAAFAGSLSDIFRPVRVQAFNTRPGEDQLFEAPDASEALEASSYAGVGGAMGELADYYVDLADQIVPFIEVDAGRKIDLILLKGAALEIREN
jgi:conjugal transfer pilus assembly protein TraB